MNEELIAPCGMNCSLCIHYLAMKYDLNNKGFNRKYCPGCRPRGNHCLHMQNQCVKLGTGTVDFCYECEQFPCKRLRSLDKRYRTNYHLSMIENLEFIKTIGMAEFLKKEEEVWRCPRCNNEICCHNGLCLNCDLELLKHNRTYRWEE